MYISRDREIDVLYLLFGVGQEKNQRKSFVGSVGNQAGVQRFIFQVNVSTGFRCDELIMKVYQRVGHIHMVTTVTVSSRHFSSSDYIIHQTRLQNLQQVTFKRRLHIFKLRVPNLVCPRETSIRITSANYVDNNATSYARVNRRYIFKSRRILD